MWPKPIASITANDITNLIVSQVSESRHLEFKRQPPDSSKEQTAKFLLAVAAMANAGGGYLIYGIDTSSNDSDQSGVANAIVPIEQNVDQLIVRLDNILQSSVHPRVYPIMRAVTVTETEYKLLSDRTGSGNSIGSGKGTANGARRGDGSGSVGGTNEQVGQVLLIRIPASINTPHAVQINDAFRFPIRVSAGRTNMDMNEIRRSISISEGVAKDAVTGIKERVEQLRPHFREGSLVVQLVPIMPEPGCDVVASLQEDEMSLTFVPLYAPGGWNHRYNADGFCTYSTREDGTTNSSTQLYRSGKLELFTNYVSVNNVLDHLKVLSIAFNTLPKCFQKLEETTQPYPLIISMAMSTSPETYIRDFWHDGMKIGQSDIFIEPTIVEERPSNWQTAMRPVFNILYNAFGYKRCPHYDAQGNWKGLT